MTIARRDTTPRRGFTLIELIVVMAIIAVLMALITAGVMKVLHRGPELQARKDIESLQAAVSQTESKHGVEYIPSRIRLYENMATYDTDTSKLAQDSRSFLRSFFGPNLGANVSRGYIDWNGDGAQTAAAMDLSGDQCLVFFLGGIPDRAQNKCLGFSDSPRDPSQTTGGRRGPYYQFPADRLVRQGRYGFFSYLDPFEKDQVFVYFSNYGTRGYGYSARVYGSYDYSGISPYYTGSTSSGAPNYRNASSFQIICAGADGKFGPGGDWGPANPATGNGRDDLSNFNPAILGAP